MHNDQELNIDQLSGVVRRLDFKQQTARFRIQSLRRWIVLIKWILRQLQMTTIRSAD